jgi:SagB-type dehydrogenase family enzyme
MKEKIEIYRNFMKSNHSQFNGLTDQQRNLPQPPLQKPYDKNGRIINLPEVDENILKRNELYKCLKERRSIRQHSNSLLSLKELSFLLWATQGVEKIIRDGYATLRPVPSAGARHPFETYLAVNRVSELDKGVYRYLPLTHQLFFLFSEDNMKVKLNKAVFGQTFVGNSAVVFIWTCIPYRAEWRYSILAHKAMLLDAGHICQNLYLACESIECGTCAIAAYDQEAIDKFLKLDGVNEFVIYLAPVGRKI